MSIRDKISEYYSINKKARQKELWLEWILFSVVVVILICLFVHVIQTFSANKATTPAIASAGALVASLALVWQLFSSIRNKQFTVSLGLKADVSDHDIIISASITNIGTRYIYPMKTNIYISQGTPQIIQAGKAIDFEPINMHKKGCFDCYAKEQMDKDLKNRIVNPTDKPYTPSYPQWENSSKYKNTTRIAYNCKLLSDSSIMYIKPKESFVEDIVITMNDPGYYRIVMIYTDKKWNDCICTSTSVRIMGESKKDKA